MEALLSKNRSHTASSSSTPLTNKPVAPAPSTTSLMANKLLYDYSIPAVANVPIRIDVNTGNGVGKPEN